MKQTKHTKRKLYVGVSLLLIGFLLIGIGITDSIHPFSVAPLDPSIDGDEVVPIEDTDNDGDGDTETYIYVEIGGFWLWVLLSDDNSSIYYNGAWYFIPDLVNILNNIIPEEEEEEFDIDTYLDTHIPDDQKVPDPTAGGYDEQRIPSYPFYIVGSILSFLSIFIIVRKRRPHIATIRGRI